MGRVRRVKHDGLTDILKKLSLLRLVRRMRDWHQTCSKNKVLILCFTMCGISWNTVSYFEMH